LYDIIDIVNYIYSLTFNYFINDIKLISNNLNVISDTVYCCYIGNYENGLKLLETVSVKSYEMMCFVIRSKKLYDKLLSSIEDKFKNFIIFVSKEYGNDIIPTLQSLNYLLNKYNIKYVYKFHTKGDNKMFEDLSNYLVNLPSNKIKENLNYGISNCIAKKEYYKSLKQDVFNKKLIKEHLNKIDHNLSFVVATIFCCESLVITKVLEFIKSNDFRQYFINNLYDTNIILFKNSPIHFIERLFGVIKI
jgi:hypothetical protein